MNSTTQIALGLALATVAVLVVGNLPGLRRPRPGAIPAAEAKLGIIHLTAAEYPALRDQAKPVVMDFWAPWCGPCRQQGPILEAFAALAGDRVLVAKVNVDDEKALAAQYGVRAIPTLIVMKDGKEVRRMVGVTSAQDLLQAVR